MAGIFYDPCAILNSDKCSYKDVFRKCKPFLGLEVRCTKVGEKLQGQKVDSWGQAEMGIGMQMLFWWGLVSASE